ncbi:hypothetical protein [Streptomyces nitrosporeus]|uniref:hypothetical protein n=1 Tax=Streptomyces nitrosporeus TaxID=28894 RepID=UPI00331D3A6A
MRARPARRVRLLAAGLLLLATGCGIRATGVVEVGGAAEVQVSGGGPQDTVLYFVHAGGLMPVVRQVEPLGGDPSGTVRTEEKVLAMLLAGPDAREREAGLRTELPSGSGVVSLDLVENGVLVRLGRPVTGLSGLARRQLVCTAAEALVSGGGEPVTVVGTDTSFGPDTCEL